MRFLFLSCFLGFGLAACATAPPEIKRLSPLPETLTLPSQCRIISVRADSPAQKGGLLIGDTIHRLNGVVPVNAPAVSDLVRASGSDMDLEVAQPGGVLRQIKIHLNDKWPRLGAVCDLTGWRKNGVSAAGNESVTIYSGPFALTVSGVIDNHLVFMRANVVNYSEKDLEVSPALFRAFDGDRGPLSRLSPRNVMKFLHGEKGARLFKSLTPTDEESSGLAGPLLEQRESSAHYEYIEANADYLSKESLRESMVHPGDSIDGLVYFTEPKVLPFMIKANMAGHLMIAQFGLPKLSQAVPPDQLAPFFESAKKGTPMRLSLKNGKVFVGKFSSYDAIDEIAWFSTPSGGLLNSSSFSLDNIANAQSMDQAPAPPAKPSAGPEQAN